MIRVSGTSETKTKDNIVSLESQKAMRNTETEKGLEEIITENLPNLEEAKTRRFRKLSKPQTN